ncbi:hypothetical protein [Streptomyces sp. NBC_01483]|uniref:hypothetical protein n=1 Tax=Streptomyces sp. NBC_01483 TaxID=2903883 RepID=UPI002E33E1FE|nr:hypothetical protein [Streptomyces sp. NBC_01483]
MTVALATATAVLGGLVSAAPATADEPGDNPANPYERTLRISLGAQARKDRCQVARAVHYGGPELKNLAATRLTGTDAALRTAVGTVASANSARPCVPTWTRAPRQGRPSTTVRPSWTRPTSPTRR